jgi:TPP-dependent pyruvate/acetoin dehydrogenase alpha subunit
MQAEGILGSDDLDAADGRSRELVDEAVRFAEASPLPDLADLYTHVYVD